MLRAQFLEHARHECEHWWFTARREILLALIAKILPAGGKLLEVGCGTGGNLAAFVRHYECLGIDPSADAIEIAREQFPDLNVRQGFAPQDCEAELRSADLVLLLDVLEHVPDDAWLLGQLVSQMKPGAHILITVPADLSLWSMHDVSHGHFRRYDRALLQRAWSSLPVAVHLLAPFNSRLYPIVSGVRWWNRLRGTSSGDHGTDLKVPASPINRLLHSVFAGEKSRLLSAMDGSARPATRGVSLVALLQTTEEKIPSTVTAAAPYQPVPGEEHLPTESIIAPLIERSNFRPVPRPTATYRAVSQTQGDASTTIVVPCYNESKRLKQQDFLSFLETNATTQLLFVDDGSADSTLASLESLRQKNPSRIAVARLVENSGKGEAVRHGIQLAIAQGAGVVGFMDADLATPLSEFSRLQAALQANPQIALAMGSRVRLLGRDIQRATMRHYCGRAAATLISWQIDLPVYDTQCGAKLFRVDNVARQVFAEPFCVRWLFDVEILIRYMLARHSLTNRNGSALGIVEVPLETWHDVSGSKVRAADFGLALRELWRLRRLYGRSLKARRRAPGQAESPRPTAQPEIFVATHQATGPSS